MKKNIIILSCLLLIILSYPNINFAQSPNAIYMHSEEGASNLILSTDGVDNREFLWTIGGPTLPYDTLYLQAEATSGAKDYFLVMSWNAYGNVGVGTSDPQSALHINGYTQLSLSSSTPPAADCDEASERGRMKVNNVAGLLYICVDSGWISK